MARSGQLKSAALQAAMQTMHDAHKGEARTKFGLQLKRIEADLMDGPMSSSALKFETSGKEQPEKLGMRLAYKDKDRITNADYVDSDDEEYAAGSESDTDGQYATQASRKDKIQKKLPGLPVNTHMFFEYQHPRNILTHEPHIPR